MPTPTIERKVVRFLTLVSIFLFPFIISIAPANANEEPIHIPGIIEGTGTHFEITDSEYINIILDSTGEIIARIESMPEMVVLEINASTGVFSSNIRISGFSPNTTYHKYEDDYHNYAPLTTDENGTFSFEQDISQNHIIFIQPRKSTKFIKDDFTGGDCESIGSWSILFKTCTLNQDFHETIQIDDSGITLDGGGHTLSGTITGNGIYVPHITKNISNTAIKNITITGFSNGIYLYNSSYNKIVSTNVSANGRGIYIYGSHNILQNNIIENNNTSGLVLLYSNYNAIKDNTVGPGNTMGISGMGNVNTYENNLITGNDFGFFGSGNDNVLKNNKIEKSEYDGFNFYGKRDFLRGNSVAGSGRQNLQISSNDMDLDTSNTVEGKPIYSIIGAVGKTYDSSLNVGAFYCSGCSNITLTGHELARGRSQIHLWNTNNSTINNITSPDSDVEIGLVSSSNNTIKESNFGGIVLVSSSNNNKIYNNNIGANFSPVTIDSSNGNMFNLPVPIGGNYWKNFTSTCRNKNGDNFCDSPLSIGKMTDYLPLAKPFEWNLQKRLPVILIPGIGASLNPDLMFGGVLNDNWTLLSHTYDGIIDAFKAMGYEEGKDFFIAYYDWRNKNEDSAKDYLEPLIDKALISSGAPKVNIVAHSMGGLVARSYIQSGDYRNDVDNLFLIATPNKGSSDVYPVWEGGYVPKNWDTKLAFYIYLNYLDIMKLTFNGYDSVHNYIASVKQLMPVYDYIFPKGEPQNLKNYSAMNEVNNWLENLNNGIQELNERVKVSIISGDNKNTVNGIPVINVDDSSLWVDGKPDPLDPERNDDNGDGRVLLSSSQIQSLHNDIFSSSHGDIVSESEQLIASRINSQLDVIHPAPDIPSELGFWFASPVDVEIKDPEGRIISSSKNEVPLAKYVSESKPEGFKLFDIPNPTSGNYEIKLTGNGSGEFHMGSEYMDYKDGDNDASYLLGGMINSGDSKTYILKYDPENPKEAVTPAFPANISELSKYAEDQKNLKTLDLGEADLILVKLKVIGHLVDRIYNKEGKEEVIENYKEQANRQIDWLIDYVRNKSGKKAKGEIAEDIAETIIEGLKFIKF